MKPGLPDLFEAEPARVLEPDLPVNVVISNIPGPQFPIYGCGSRLVANYPVSAITDGVGLNITVQSYDGSLDFGVIACRELVPELWDLIDYLRDSLDELKEAAKQAEAGEQGDGYPTPNS